MHSPAEPGFVRPAQPAEDGIWGTVVEILPRSMFRVRLEKGQTVLAHVLGPFRNELSRIFPGDRVRLELSAYDPGRGRITGHRPG